MVTSDNPGSVSRTDEVPSEATSPGSGSDNATWIIRRKISPPSLGPLVVRRRRVENLIIKLVDQHRLVCVYASAGAGKTTAILQAADRSQRKLAWLDVDTTDAATGRLLVYLEAALSPQVPAVAGVATSALAAQIPHAEVAGLLAESIGDANVLIVLDNGERLAASSEALDLVTSFVRYLPTSARLVIASRSELPFRSSVGSSPWVAAVGEDDVALTVEEATDALKAIGRTDIDPVEAIVETGGWMTGVLLEAWRATDHVIGLGGEVDPLHGYLATEILGQLDPNDVDFLIDTALLPEVTVKYADALGLDGASERMHSLSGRRLPVSWHLEETVMRCHPRFREFLLKRFGRRGEQEQRVLHRAYARLLIGENHHEEAVEEYLAAGCLKEALEIIHPVLERAIERADFALAERWMAALVPIRDDDDDLLASAELMLIVVREKFSAGVELADRLERRGRRLELARSSGRAAGLMAWCYLHAGRVQEIDAILAVAELGPERDVVRYVLSVIRDEQSEDGPTLGRLSGGPLDALVLRIHYDLGRLSLLKTPPRSRWAAKASESWLVSALLAAGHIEQAFEVYHRLVNTSDQSVWLTALVGPRLMSEIGDHEEAWRLLREGRERILATGSLLFESYSLLLEAEFELRLNADPVAATTLLEGLQTHPVGSRYALVNEQRHMLTGLALLVASRNTETVDHLRPAVAGMQRGGRLLFLATAAVYLSEAEWRVGDEAAADRAANLAMSTAARQGSNHYLLNALSEFPDVLTRRIDLESTAESAWHDLGRAIRVRPLQHSASPPAMVEVAEFGRMTITVDGDEVKPGLHKSLELLAFLATCERDEVSRNNLVDALFAGQRSASSLSYLRQAVLKLRKAIPGVLEAKAGTGTVRLSADVRVSTESQRFISLLSEGSAMRGDERLRLLLAALEIADRGPYLPDVGSAWVDDRRQRLDELVRSARVEAAEAAFVTGQYTKAASIAEAVVAVDPYRETAWRLLMKVAQALGDHDRVISTFRSCERALAELGVEPEPTTVRLLRHSGR